MDRYPFLRSPLLQGWQCYRLAYAHAGSLRDSLLHAHHTNISPFDVACVDPDRIEYLVEQNGYPSQTYDEAAFPESKFKYAGTVRGGDWDRLEVRFEETDLYRAFEAHFERDVPWSDTAFFEQTVDYIEDGVVLWGCSTRDEFERRCERLDRLYESIRREGYRSARELAAKDPNDPIRYNRTTSEVSGTHDEITVCIGRDGDLLFFDGRNRLAISKLLDLDAVPVWIMFRHEKWQRLREHVAREIDTRSQLPARLRGHPDLTAAVDR